ncbi:hypothetical protein EG834_09445 [bacterium]|nr:hypothetical protein [bacterium]
MKPIKPNNPQLHLIPALGLKWILWNPIVLARPDSCTSPILLAAAIPDVPDSGIPESDVPVNFRENYVTTVTRRSFSRFAYQ